MRPPKADPLRGRLRAALRQVWLRSPERAAALKRDNYTCQAPGCNKKQSKAKGREVKVQVHHIELPNWDMAIDAVLACGLFCKKEKLITYDKECHKKIKEV